MRDRTDHYGGTLEKRLRFPLDVAQAVVDVWGADLMGIRISPVIGVPANTPLDGNP